MSKFNNGDTVHIILEHTVNGVPLEDADLDDIELTVGNKQYTVSGGDIELIEGKFELFLDQEDTFALDSKTPYHIRIVKDGEVGSPEIKSFPVGGALSDKIIGAQENGA